MRDDIIIDCFAGGGGASVGIEMALGRPVDIAVNHDPMAIRMHETNHPQTLHLTEDIFKVNLTKYVKGQHVSLMWASPDCTSHSKAKGGQPRCKGLRILPWAVFKHAKAVTPDVIIMENVEEIQQWGPLDDEGHPIKELAGMDYKKFINAMVSIGYDFESRELVAACYGAPTTRKRWYAIFRRDGRPIVWPEPTLDKDHWVPVSTCLDFSDLGSSIFSRKKPLAISTQRRIAFGIKKFILDDPDPFYVSSQRMMPFLIQYHSETSEMVRGQKVTEALKTIDTSNRYGLVSCLLEECGEAPRENGVAAFLTSYYSSSTGQNMREPLRTITTDDRFGLVTVKFQKYQITDIMMRMLKPEELKEAQGFPKDYIIDRYADWSPVSHKEQVARIGNSVVPIMAEALVKANCPYLKDGERVPLARLDYSQPQARFA